MLVGLTDVRNNTEVVSLAPPDHPPCSSQLAGEGLLRNGPPRGAHAQPHHWVRHRLTERPRHPKTAGTAVSAVLGY